MTLAAMSPMYAHVLIGACISVPLLVWWAVSLRGKPDDAIVARNRVQVGRAKRVVAIAGILGLVFWGNGAMLKFAQASYCNLFPEEKRNTPELQKEGYYWAVQTFSTVGYGGNLLMLQQHTEAIQDVPLGIDGEELSPEQTAAKEIHEGYQRLATKWMTWGVLLWGTKLALLLTLLAAVGKLTKRPWDWNMLRLRGYITIRGASTFAGMPTAVVERLIAERKVRAYATADGVIVVSVSDLLAWKHKLIQPPAEPHRKR